MGEAKRKADELADRVAHGLGSEDRPMSAREWRLLFDVGRLPNRAVFVETSDGSKWRYPGPFERSRALAEAAARERINPERRWAVGAVDRATGVVQLVGRNLRSEEAARLRTKLLVEFPEGPRSPFELLIVEADLTGRFLKTADGSRHWRHPDELPEGLPV